MGWLLFKQTLSGNISYLSDKSDNLQFLSYDKFLYYLVTNFYIQNFNKLKEELNSFNIIYLDNETGEWIVKQPNLSHFSFDELLEIQNSNKEKNKNTSISREECFYKLQKAMKKNKI